MDINNIILPYQIVDVFEKPYTYPYYEYFIKIPSDFPITFRANVFLSYKNHPWEDFDIEVFRNYYYSEFDRDFDHYFPQQDKMRGYKFILTMGGGRRKLYGYNNEREDFRTEEYMYYFMIICFHMSLFAQVICRCCGIDVMHAFHKSSHCPYLNCGGGGLMHPTHTMVEADLYPFSGRCRDRYLYFFKKISHHLEETVVSFLEGGKRNYDKEKYTFLVEKMSGKISQFRNICHEVSNTMIVNLEKGQTSREIKQSGIDAWGYFLTQEELYPNSK